MVLNIGITGRYGAGKDSVATILEQQGFVHISLSDIIRDHLRMHAVELTRDNIIKMGDHLRQTFGADFLARQAMKKMQEGKNHIFSSIRNPAEVVALKELDGFTLIEITAPIETRLKRLQERDRENDPTTLEELKCKEGIESTNDPTRNQLHKVSEMANVRIENASTIKDLERNLQDVVQGSS